MCRASPLGAAPVSNFFASIALPPWRSAFSQFARVVNLGFPVLASGSNCAVKPTRLRRAAYFRSLARCRNRFVLAHGLFTCIHLLKRLSAGCFAACWASPLFGSPVSSLFGVQRLRSKRYQLSFCKHCAASVARCFFAVSALRQVGVSLAGVCV